MTVKRIAKNYDLIVLFINFVHLIFNHKKFKPFIMKILVAFILTFSLCILNGCKKSTNNSSEAESQWTILGHTYTTDSTYFDNTNIDLAAADTAQNAAAVTFNYKPTKSGKFTVINASTISGPQGLDSSQCVVNVNIAGSIFYYSTATTGTVSVTISAGKLNIIFTDVSLKNAFNGSDSTYASGTLHEK
jgi:hypothetical protein